MKNENSSGDMRFSALINEYLPLIRGVCASFEYEYLGLAREDLELEGMLGLYRAAESYDESREASFYTYAKRCICNAVTEAVRSAARKKHLPLNARLSYEELEALPSENEGEIDALELKEALEEAVRSALSSLEREALRLHLEGLSAEEAAKRLGRSVKSFENALQRARKKLEDPLRG